MKIYINNEEVNISSNVSLTVLEVCSLVGIHIPRFCYHQELSIAGNCRLCLIELDKSPKPVAACALPIVPNMKVYTDTPLVQKARENVLEFILINHPLDCPICDQGGECDLQDQVLTYGSDQSRFFEYKRSVEDKSCGPLIKTIMTRCIHCTRCIRFLTEIAGVYDLGTTNRGQFTEIGTYSKKFLFNELSGNIIDLCPVGALTSKPYAFKARPWELQSIDSIDIFDGVSSKIRIDFSHSEIIRILPRGNEWITDKIRFSFDGLKYQRLLNPLFQTKTTLPKSLSWKALLTSFHHVIKRIHPKDITLIVGNSLDTETLIATKFLASCYGIQQVSHDKESTLDTSFIPNYQLSLKNLEQTDCCFLVGTNLKLEATLLHLKVQNLCHQKSATIANLGSNYLEATFPIYNLSSNFSQFIQILEGHHQFCKVLKKAKFPLLIYGSQIIQRYDSHQLSHCLKQINQELTIFNENSIGFLASDSNQVGNCHTGISSTSWETNLTTKFLYGIDIKKDYLTSLSTYKNFYRDYNLPTSLSSLVLMTQGTHYFSLPRTNIFSYHYLISSKAFTEQEGTYYNFHNTQQLTYKLQNSQQLNQVKESWQISLFFTTLLQNINYLCFNWIQDCLLEKIPLKSSSNDFIWHQFYLSKSYFLKLQTTFIKPTISNFYSSHIILENSKLMGQCSELARTLYNNF